MRIFLIILFVISAAVIAQENSSEQAFKIRLDEINSYPSKNAIWEGAYRVRYVSPELLRSNELEGGHPESVGLRMDITDSENPNFFLKFDENTGWSQLEGELYLFETEFGWQLLVDRSAGFWVERYLVSVERVSEYEAQFAFVRTVHNWYVPDNESDTPVFFTVLGDGSLFLKNRALGANQVSP